MSTENEEIKEDTLKEDEKPAKPWETILIGLGLIAFGIFLYYTFNNLEQEGGSFFIDYKCVFYVFLALSPQPLRFIVVGGYGVGVDIAAQFVCISFN